MKRKSLVVFLALILILPALAAGCGSQAPASTAKPAAGKDGLPDLKGQKLVVYVTFHENEGKRLLELFKDKTGCDYSFIRLPAGEAVARVMAEKGAPKTDIVLGGPADAHETLKDAGLLVAYESKTGKELPAYYRSKENFWHGLYVGPLSIVVNKDRFEKEFKPKGIEVPKTFEDLLNPAFKGEIIMPDPATSGTAYTLLASLSQVSGQDKTIEYMKKLKANIGQFTSSGFTPAQKVGTGEYLIGVNFIHDQLLVQKSGFNLIMNVPNNAGWEIGAVSIVKGGPNTEAAKAFMDFVIGKEAGQLHSDLTMRISTRSDVNVPYGAKKLEEMPINKDYSFDKANKEKKELVAKFKSLSN